MRILIVLDVLTLHGWVNGGRGGAAAPGSGVQGEAKSVDNKYFNP